MEHARPRAVRGHCLGGARDRARRLRLGVPEGRPREPRGRRVDVGGPAPARPSRPARPRARRGPGDARERPRPSPADARAGAPAARGRVLLVGDAAGLVDPLSGDGMYEAFVSAELAAAAISMDVRRPTRLRSRPRSISTLGVLEGEARRRSLPPCMSVGTARARRLRRDRRSPPWRSRTSERGSWARPSSDPCSVAAGRRATPVS